VSIRDEVRASAAAHRDLGPGYDTAVAEGLVERIGEEIDKRVDARLYAQAPYQSPPPRPRLRREPVPGRIGFGAVVLGLGSMGMAIGATAAVLHPGDSPGQVSGGAAVLIALIWIVIGVVNVAYARYRLLSALLFGSFFGSHFEALFGSLSVAYLWRSLAGCSVRS
jgi:hypothetical protein